MSEVFGKSVVEHCMQNVELNSKVETSMPCKTILGYFWNCIKIKFEKSMEQMVHPFLVAIARFVNPF